MQTPYTMSMNKHGLDHRIARQEKIEHDGYQCEVTGMTTDVEAHHVVPRYMDGPDNKWNYQLLQQEFHRQLHDATWSDRPDLIGMRKHVKKKVINNPESVELKERLERIDEKLAPDYIRKLMNNLEPTVRDIVIEQTLISNFHTIRDLNIEVLQLRKQIADIYENGHNVTREHIIEGEFTDCDAVVKEQEKRKRREKRKKRRNR